MPQGFEGVYSRGFQGNDFIGFHVPGNLPDNTPNLMVLSLYCPQRLNLLWAPAFLRPIAEVAPAGAPAIGSQCHPTVEISTMLHEFWLACQRTFLSSMN